MRFFIFFQCIILGILLFLSSLITPQIVYANHHIHLTDQQINTLLNGSKKSYKAKKTSQHVTQKAKQMLHVPYRWGGTTPRGFDCSGLVQYSYKRVGIKLPRTAAQQYRAVRKVKRKHMTKGDLIFFHTPRRGRYVNHVGIYMGNNKFIHAPGRGKRVQISKLSRYWKSKMVGVGRTG